MSMLARARFFLLKSFMLLISWSAQISVQEQSAIRGGQSSARLYPEPLYLHTHTYMYSSCY